MSAAAVVRLQDVADINPPLGVTPSTNETVSFLPMAAVDADHVDAVDTQTRSFHEVNKGYTPFLRDDVLVAKITPCFENGKIAQAKPAHRFGFGSTEFHVVRSHVGELDPRYLAHFLRQPRIRVAGQRRMTGSAGQRRVPEHFLANLRVPLPPLPEQRRIAAILDAADGLRAKRRAAIAKLDELTQSIFLDMFGDPATNPRGWPTGAVGDLIESAQYGTSERSKSAGEFAVLRMNNITPAGAMDLTDLKFMDVDEAHRERYLVRAGDVLFNRTNSAALVGKTGIIRDEQPMAYAGYLIRLRVTSDNDPEYLWAFLNSAYSKLVLRGMCKSIIGMANINAKEVQRIRISRPPHSLQRKFACRVQAVEALKRAHRAGAVAIESLFGSTEQRAFRGEL